LSDIKAQSKKEYFNKKHQAEDDIVTAVFRYVEQQEQTNILLIWALKNF
jgi:hypothetical protein